MGIAEQIYLTIHIQRVVSEKKHPIIRIVTVWQAKPGLKNRFTNVCDCFFNLGFILNKKKEGKTMDNQAVGRRVWEAVGGQKNVKV